MAKETEATNSELTCDSEESSLPLQDPAIEAARTLFTLESLILDSERADPEFSERLESEHSERPESEHSMSEDIIKILHTCLKDAKKYNNTPWGIKTVTQIVAVIEYVKLCARYHKHNACRRPCLNASLAIARGMGKGPYFARQIRHIELYLLRHHCLPPPKSYTKHGHHTLLDNEVIVQNIRTYLAAQALGTVMPRKFCEEVNGVILPALGINGTISESTAQRWLRFKLGYQSKEVKMGVYIDGHERLDVIRECEEFIDLIFKYER